MFDQDSVKAAGGPAVLDAIRRGLRGYAGGGYVSMDRMPSPLRSIGTGSFPETRPASSIGNAIVIHQHIEADVTAESAKRMAEATASEVRKLGKTVRVQQKQIDNTPDMLAAKERTRPFRYGA